MLSTFLSMLATKLADNLSASISEKVELLIREAIRKKKFNSEEISILKETEQSDTQEERYAALEKLANYRRTILNDDLV